jgi:sec-independent protein translocase protein TatC
MSLLEEINKSEFVGHLKDLKTLLFKLVISWGLGSVIATIYQKQIFDFLVGPVSRNNLSLHFLSPSDSLMFVIKIVMLSGFVISLPLHVYFFWQYIKPALKLTEIKFFASYFWVISILSIVATIYGWLSMIPTSLNWLINFTPAGTALLLTANEYFSFILSILLILLIIFQTPVVVFSLIKSGVVTADQVKSKRKEIWMGIIIFSAFFGSPDLISWALSCVPVIILFEGSLSLSTIKLSKKQ